MYWVEKDLIQFQPPWHGQGHQLRDQAAQDRHEYLS